MSGDIPTWIWKIPMLVVSHNRFNASLPPIPNTLLHLDLSKNFFSGGMSHFLCDATHHTYELRVLRLEGNRLSGELPDCWVKWASLQYFNLGYNNLTGSIPNSIGNLASLKYLNIPGNRLSGEIPLSLHNCTELVKLDVANNFLGGGIPTWLGRGLAFLILRSNNITGNISSQLCRLNALQILDISDNKISGRMPRCFYNLTAMATKRSLYRLSFSLYWSWTYTFPESATVAIKGRELEYKTILSLVTNMDLSSNNLSGEIPKELTRLVELRSLNLSQNRFTGSIPENIGDMKQLEWLDLSNNSLSGHIPNSLKDLSFLKDLNLSYNNLTGGIPKGTQLGSMDASSFIGNNLCGPPLTGDCGHNGDEDDGRKDEGEEEEEEGESKIEWIYVVTSVGYAVGLSAVCSALALNKSWRQAYFGLLEWIWNQMYVYVCIKWNKISG